MRRAFAVVAVAVALGLVGCTRGSAAPERADLVVFLASDVTAEQRSAIEQRMRTTSNVEGVTFETREQAYEKFKQQFKDQPELVQQTKPESMPESFAATVTDASIVEAVEIMMQTVDGVSDTVIRAPASYGKEKAVGVILRLDSGVTEDQRGAIEKAVHAVKNAGSIKFESKEDAATRLKKRCGGKADLAGALDAEKTSASFRFKVELKKQSPTIDRLRRLDGVKTMLFVPVSTL